jgi:hypothetical protein
MFFCKENEMHGIPKAGKLVKITLKNGNTLDYMFVPYDFRGNFINAIFGGTINIEYVDDWVYQSEDELSLYETYNAAMITEHVKNNPINRNAQGVDYTARRQGDNK